MYVSSFNVFVAQINIGLGLFQLLLFLVSLFLILLVLVQRGKGGGLTGALGGMGGQSAFGNKAGDAFTRITIFTTLVWITLCMVTVAWFNPPPAAKVTKEMTLMEKARALDYAPSVGAPAEDGDVPSDFRDDATSMGTGSGVTADEDNVAVKQTPENTDTKAAMTDSQENISEESGSAATATESAESQTADSEVIEAAAEEAASVPAATDQ